MNRPWIKTAAMIVAAAVLVTLYRHYAHGHSWEYEAKLLWGLPVIILVALAVRYMRRWFS